MTKTIQYTLILFVWIIVNSCTWEQEEPTFNCADSPLEIEKVDAKDASCGEVNGTFQITIIGGNPPYKFESDLGTNADGKYINLSAGTYLVKISDSKDCSLETTVSINNIDGVNITDVAATASGCNTANGRIEIKATGGSSPLVYTVGNTSQQSNIFTGLNRGTYTLKVRDQLGCETSQSVSVLSGVSYDTSVKNIIANNCAISGCHSGSVSPDLRTFNGIKSAATRVKTRTGAKTMPPGSPLAQSEIDLIACWVDDGALQN